MKDPRVTLEESRTEGRPHMLQNGLGCRQLRFREAKFSPLLPFGVGEVFGMRRSSVLLTSVSGHLWSTGFRWVPI